MSAEEMFQLEVVNDISVIIRIQGQRFESSEVYEPVAFHPDMNLVTHRTISAMQLRGAKMLGFLFAQNLMQVADSELGRRLQRDKWLTNVMCAVHMALGLHKEQLAKKMLDLRQQNSRSVLLTDGRAS